MKPTTEILVLKSLLVAALAVLAADNINLYEETGSFISLITSLGSLAAILGVACTD